MNDLLNVRGWWMKNRNSRTMGFIFKQQCLKVNERMYLPSLVDARQRGAGLRVAQDRPLAGWPVFRQMLPWH